jgi:heptosyltransferase-2
MMATIAECDLLLCNDSGPMHIAEALGVPVTALFGGSRVDWYGPRGDFHETINVEVMPCRPCFDACIFSSARCMEGISSDRVVTTLLGQLDRVSARRIDRATPTGEI